VPAFTVRMAHPSVTSMKYILIWFILGIVGWLIEVVFTGINSLFRRDWAATSKTYLWMHPIYASGGMAVYTIYNNVIISANPFLDAVGLAFFIYVPLFYGFEALSGLASIKLFGRILWDYGRSKWTPMGLINLKYAPYWFLLALCMHPVVYYLGKIIDLFMEKL
jgi:uncharacterized membrane protein